MINQKRFDDYISEMNEQLRGLSSEEQIKSIEAKVFNLLASRNIRPSETRRLQRLLAPILDDELTPLLNDIVERYDDVLSIVNELYADDLGVDVQRDFQFVRSVEIANRQEFGSYKERTLRDMTARIREGLLANDTVGELQERIRATASNKAQRNAQIIAETQVNTYGRALKAEQSRRAGIMVYEYVGVVRGVTRPFCRAMAGTSHSRRHINLMMNGNREPVLINCGGWRCVHSWEPDPFASEPDDGEMRTVEEGNRRVILRATEGAMARYQEAKELNRKAFN